MLDIHALRVFLEAARTENFTEAGRLLNLTQPAVSMQIRSLENYLQTELFERDGRSIRLTKTGQALVPLAQQIVQLAISAEDSIRAADGKVFGNLVIGCSTASGKYILPHIVANFQRVYPDVRVSIPVVGRTIVMESVASGEYDLGVVSLRSPGYELNYTRFFTDKLALVVPASHQWARRGVIQPHELLAERFVCREAGSACRVSVGQGLAALDIDVNQLNVVMEVGNPEALAMAVEHGIGVSFISLLAATPRLALGRLALVEVAGLDLHTEIDLVTCSSRPASLVRMKFLDFIHQPQNQSLITMLAQGRMI